MEALQAYQLEAAFCPVNEQADETGSADFLPSMRARHSLSQVGFFLLKDRQMFGSCPSRAQQGPGSPVHVGCRVSSVNHRSY